MTTKSAFNEDKVALLLGCIIFILGLGKFAGLDLLGWVVKIGMWVDSPVDAWKPATKGLMAGWQSLVATYVFVTALLALGVKLMKGNVGRFVGSFTVIFFIAIACYTAGANAKIAIVVLGAELGVKAADAAGFAGHVIFRGLCAIVEAYLLYWAVVYYVARKYFKFNKEWAAPLASGISICGVSAAIATGGAIRARPVVPIMVSSLVVVFTCIEMLILPFIAQYFLYSEPMVAGGWMGLAVKSDGGAIASGAITESLILAKMAGLGTEWEPGWIVMVTTTVKIFIDMFIGIWALVLAYIWTAKFDKTRGDRTMTWGDVMDRFPRFVLGYLGTFLILLIVCLSTPELHKVGKAMSGAMNGFRVIFFLMTFFSIGMVSNFRKLMEEGIGRLAIVYIVCLFGFIIWVGLFISYAFFHGMTPPVVGA